MMTTTMAKNAMPTTTTTTTAMAMTMITVITAMMMTMMMAFSALQSKHCDTIANILQIANIAQYPPHIGLIQPFGLHG